MHTTQFHALKLQGNKRSLTAYSLQHMNMITVLSHHTDHSKHLNWPSYRGFWYVYGIMTLLTWLIKTSEIHFDLWQPGGMRLSGIVYPFTQYSTHNLATIQKIVTNSKIMSNSSQSHILWSQANSRLSSAEQRTQDRLILLQEIRKVHCS